jgi:hypothetical protein
MSGFFRRYFSQIDGPEPHLVLDLVDDDLRFAVLFSTDPTSEPREFSGGRAELAAYLKQRGQPSWTHHVLHEAVVDGRACARGDSLSRRQARSDVRARWTSRRRRTARALFGRAHACDPLLRRAASVRVWSRRMNF